MPTTDDAVVPGAQQFFASNLPPTRAQKQLALTVLLGILVIIGIVRGPLSQLRTSPVLAFIPIT